MTEPNMPVDRENWKHFHDFDMTCDHCVKGLRQNTQLFERRIAETTEAELLAYRLELRDKLGWNDVPWWED